MRKADGSPTAFIGLVYYLLLVAVFCCPAGFLVGMGFTGAAGLATFVGFDLIAALLTVL